MKTAVYIVEPFDFHKPILLLSKNVYMKLALQKVFTTCVFLLVSIALLVINGCNETQHILDINKITVRYCKSVLITANDLSEAYTTAGDHPFQRLSLSIGTTPAGEIYPIFYGVAADGSRINFRNISVLDGTQKIWLKPIGQSNYDIVKSENDQIKALLAIPQVDHFVLQPWSFDDPNYIPDANLLEYYIIVYDGFGNEIDLTSALRAMQTNRIERLIRIDPIPPGRPF